MNVCEAIKQSLAMPDMVYKGYLEDLSNEELFLRPVEGANHIAWQLGHLINSEHSIIESVCPGTMPALPEGFAEKHTKDTAAIDDPSAFYSKDEYLKLADEQRVGTLAALEKLSDEDLDKPSPKNMQALGPNVAAMFSMQGTHWTMHSGQWAVLRRKLGRKPLF